MDPFSLDGRTAVVTGASRGIGAATAAALGRAGARVVLVGRDEAALTASAAQAGPGATTVVADLALPDAPGELADQLLARHGTVDVLVNNAGIGVRADATGLDPATVDALMAVNVRGLLLLTTGLLPAMVARGRGAVVNVSSISGRIGTPRRAAYAASKGAVDALTRSLAMEFGPRGIRVNAVAPGVIDTDLWVRNRAVPGVIAEIEAQTALRRWGTAEDVADVVVFLASDAARYVTGQTVEVDGGMAATLDLYGGAV